METGIELLPSVLVDNVVIWKNPYIVSPFNLSEGKPTNLGVFAVNKDASTQDGVSLGAVDGHGRSANLIAAYVTDVDDILYRDFDLKGIGLIGNSVDNSQIHVFPISKRNTNGETWGTWKIDTAIREKDLCEELIKNGIRTYRIVAIIELKSIALPDGEIVTIEEAKKRDLLQAEETPCVGIRAYRNRGRVHFSGEGSRLDEFNQAKKMIELELGKDLTWDEYIVWFAMTLGENVGKFHKLGYWHSFLATHNVTLACEIIDIAFNKGSEKLKDYTKNEQEECRATDFGDARMTLEVLRYQLEKLGLVDIPKETVLEIYKGNYEDSFN
jgi:hypothetical protein